ncbi:hypothetical protein JR316_0009249 [Psilocybe cubensis]|uniref:Uncharacterized protein n=2 Tax=Psilocybe cubensis TaxID=181762 RepID=A0A8H7XZA0_PSICU|nr:hypothetical protein JR316_0009249 [Psilocybe cubensis]KAH9478788.1 hypothetical protein JR316_0009249 [Psilocybe cubensis]
MVKVTSATLLVAAALVAGPVSVLAAGSGWEEFELESRSISPSDSSALSPFARETEELFGRIAEELDLREFEDGDMQGLVERSKIGHFFHKLWHGIKKVASVAHGGCSRCVSTSVIRREDASEHEILLARGAAELDNLFERTIAGIDARSPGFARFMKSGMTHVEAHPHAVHHAAHVASSLAQAAFNNRRDYEDLELDFVERDNLAFDEEIYGREYQAEEDLYGRAFEEEFERDFDELDELD